MAISKVSKKGIIVGVTDVISNLNDRLNYDGESIQEKETKDGHVAVTRNYKLVNKRGNKESLMVTDAVLIESIDKIMTAERAKNVMGYVICREMAKIADSGKLKSMGFKNIAEFGKCMFGFQTSTSNHYARIGRVFITDDYKVRDGLPELSISHFIELNAQVGENDDISEIVNLYLDGTLVDGMSTKEMRNALNKKSKIVDTTATEVKEDSKETKSETTQESGQGKKEAMSTTGTFDAQVEIQKALDAIAKFTDAYGALVSNGFSGLDNWTEILKSLVDDLQEKLSNISE